MAKNNSSINNTDNTGEEPSEAAKKSLKVAGNDKSVKAAMQKEKQPVNEEDLSPIHNTTEIGTSGGDQRASIAESNQNATNDTESGDATSSTEKA